MSQRLFQDAAKAGVYRLPADRFEATEKAAAAARLVVRSLATGLLSDIDRVLREFGSALGFPAWYGANLDALHDCLTDPEWQPTPAALFIAGLDKLGAKDPDGFSALIEVLRSAAEIRLGLGHPLWILIDADAPEIPGA